MSTEALAAVRAYAEAAQRSIREHQDTAAAGGGGAEFGSLVTQAIQDTQTQIASAEAMTQQAALGKAELVDVATAVAAAEISLETVVTLRDQVVQAYQEILRMPV